MSLRNFRGFKKQLDIPLAPLTFLVGPNSSGKSSIFSAIALIAQSGLSPRQLGQSSVIWTGELADLGSFKDAVYRHSTNLTMHIGLEFSPDLTSIAWWRRTPAKGSSNLPMRFDVAFRRYGADRIGTLQHLETKDHLGDIYYMEATDVTTGLSFRLTPVRSKRLPAIDLTFMGTTKRIQIPQRESRSFTELDELLIKQLTAMAKNQARQLRGKRAALSRLKSSFFGFTLEFFLRQVQRVSSGRGGPKRWYPLIDVTNFQNLFGVQPCFDTVNPGMVDRAKDAEHDDPKRRRRRGTIRTEKFLRELNIASKIEPYQLSPYHRSIRVTDSISNVQSNLIDVGYGASQILPVVLACQSDALAPLLIEQPEIHLHPKAQGSVADLLIQASSDRQVLVETHSVHLINRARLRILEGSLNPSDVTVLYVDRNSSGSFVQQIPIGPDGEFKAEWPEGFFEERYQESLALMAAKTSARK